MLIPLAAVDEGLGAGLFGVFGELEPLLRDRVGVPLDVAPAAVIMIGHAAPDPRWSAATSRRTQPRRPLEQFVHWERWGGTG